MKSIKIEIPDLDLCSDEQYEEVIDLLDSLPLTYKIWYHEKDEI